MDRTSAPGPGGFGPSFYRAAWGTVKQHLMAFLTAFYHGEAQLERINRSYMVLIPKKPGAVAVDAFRPICLQNCSVKILGKILTRRLQQEIGNLIDLQQTAFLRGRSISETFVFAAELVQVCNKRKLPTLVLKLDFAKAFDTVLWESLDTILEARGFQERWRSWIHTILASSKSAVLVNGCPGPWITCKRSLRQGDPLSPYLFLIVAETLQALIRSAASVRHPVDSDTPCAVLQYADDTLIVLNGDIEDVQALKGILDSFSEATGLKINYQKSTMVQIHMDIAVVTQCAAILGCSQQSFPQNYLGLPLSANKLPASAFSRYVDRTDKFLSSWQASLLNNMGRVVLINSVLDVQLVYIMSAMQVPQETINQTDKRRRSFLWAGNKDFSAGKCLVAWPNVCTTRDLGGLGIRDFGTHNVCLLLNLVHRLHCAEYSAWATWIKDKVDIANLQGDNMGCHWEVLKSLLPLYQALTTVELVDGRSTLFWTDVWTGDDALEDRFPALSSHYILKTYTVQQAISSNLQGCFTNRLSNRAQDELLQLNQILQDTQLTQQPDRRLSIFSKSKEKLDTSAIYKLLMAKGQQNDPASSFIWKNAAPPRVQMFFWLLIKGRIQCRANLFRKHIVDSPACLLCAAAHETPEHLIFHCTIPAMFWAKIGAQLPTNPQCSSWPLLPKIRGVPADQYNAFVLLCCWQNWKRRNAFVFRDENMNIRQLLLACKSDALLWRAKMPKKSKKVIEEWLKVLDSAILSLGQM